MKQYEVMLLFTSERPEEEIQKEIDAVKKDIADAHGKVTFEDFWGKKKLAYPVQKEEYGYYHVIDFTADPSFIQTLEKELRMNKKLLRYLVTTNPKEYQSITSGEVDASEERYFSELRTKKASGKRVKRPVSTEELKTMPVRTEKESTDTAEERAKKLDKILSNDLKI